ncbi:zinc finger domain-containing protein [Streptomyces sp. 900116325]
MPDDVECHPCPRCHARPGSPCRSRSGAVAGSYHTGRFTNVPLPRLATLLGVPTPADRSPGQPWRPGTPPPARAGTAAAPAITDDMVHTVLRRRVNAETVEQIQPDLIIPTGRREGCNPACRVPIGRSPNTRRPRHTRRSSPRPTSTSRTSKTRTTYRTPRPTPVVTLAWVR